jgi:ArsR family transcriptional regulator
MEYVNTFSRTAASLPPDVFERGATVLAALSHPVRLRIALGLRDGTCCVGPMVDCLDLPQPTVSRHLAVLREAGVVQSVAEGRHRTYRLTADAFVRGVLGALAPPGS